MTSHTGSLSHTVIEQQNHDVDLERNDRTENNEISSSNASRSNHVPADVRELLDSENYSSIFKEGLTCLDLQEPSYNEIMGQLDDIKGNIVSHYRTPKSPIIFNGQLGQLGQLAKIRKKWINAVLLMLGKLREIECTVDSRFVHLLAYELFSNATLEHIIRDVNVTEIDFTGAVRSSNTTKGNNGTIEETSSTIVETSSTIRESSNTSFTITFIDQCKAVSEASIILIGNDGDRSKKVILASDHSFSYVAKIDNSGTDEITKGVKNLSTATFSANGMTIRNTVMAVGVLAIYAALLALAILGAIESDIVDNITNNTSDPDATTKGERLAITLGILIAVAGYVGDRFKNMAASNWTMADLIRFRVTFTSVSEAAAYLRIHPQIIIAKIVSDLELHKSVPTSGPYDSLVRNSGVSENGIKIDVPVKSSTLKDIGCDIFLFKWMSSSKYRLLIIQNGRLLGISEYSSNRAILDVVQDLTDNTAVLGLKLILNEVDEHYFE
ncbi:hypothetical protein V1511DRAFT_489990 [Dipodascopsis uninucleata]